jgi:hypothetical protein
MRKNKERITERMTVQDLINYLETVQRHYGGDILCYVLAPAAPLPTLTPLREAATHYGPGGWVGLLLQGAAPEASDGAAGQAMEQPWRPPDPGVRQDGPGQVPGADVPQAADRQRLLR